jgi:antitoxin component of MazEF toxin-antitoxin module
MKIDTTLIEAENGKAIIIPEYLLKRLGIDSSSRICVEQVENTLVIRTSCRDGWEIAARECHHIGDDNLIIDEFFEEDFNE